MRVLALDVGGRRIGVAISDPLQVLARSLKVLQRASMEEDLAAIAELVSEWNVVAIVVGHPRTMAGEVGPQAKVVEAFCEALRRVVDVPVILWDERLSTVTAARHLRERGISAQEQREWIDATAAAVILQDYLDAQAQARQRFDEEDDGTL